MQKTSPVGLAIIKAFENCLEPVKGRPGYFKPYFDPVGVLTIGWGHTNDHSPRFLSSAVWSQQQCDDVLASDLAIFEKHVAQKAEVPLTQNEFDALVSWAFNTGGPATATLWKKLNAGDKAAVPAELARWNKAGGKVLNGLTRRRKSEGELFAGNVAAALKTAGVEMPVVPTSKPATQKPPDINDLKPDGQQSPATPQPSFWAAFLCAFAAFSASDRRASDTRRSSQWRRP